jgi:trk system potassium uptake protein TrkH
MVKRMPESETNTSGPRPRTAGLAGSGFLLPLIVLNAVLDVFFQPVEMEILLSAALGIILTAAFMWDYAVRVGRVGLLWRSVRANWFDAVVLLLVPVFCAERCFIIWMGLNQLESAIVVGGAYRLYSILFYAALALKTFTGTGRVRSFLASLGRSPSAMTAFSFTLVITVGGMILCLPQAVTNVRDVSFIDALFISTSATCVTGLASVDISQYFTRFGHVVILLLIQAGGLGIITMSVLIPILAGSKLAVTAESRLKDILEAGTLSEIRSNVSRIFLFTFVIEAAGAAVLFLDWTARDSVPGGVQATMFSAVFHSVSAFCNAGFSLFANNLEGFAANWVTSLGVAFLIILGGLGFPVLINLWEGMKLWAAGRGRMFKFSFHSKMVLSMTAGLILAGTVLILAFEWNNTLRPLDFGDKILAAFFQSVTPRTAGFNTVPTGRMSLITIFIITGLMFIGASPQSTGGGVKTTAFGTIIFTVRALLWRREHVEAFRRTIPPALIYRVSALVFISVAVCGLSLCTLLVTERAQFHEMMFEVVSAFGTVGLSTGLTPSLTVPGKIVIIATMLVGRIGPLTLAVALAERAVAGRFRYPDGQVIIG